MEQVLSLGTMNLDKAILEIRHPDALLLWDRSGSLWRAMQKVLPDLRAIEAQPNATRFALPPSDEINVDLGAHRLSCSSPDRKLAAFRQRAEHMFRIVSDTLDIGLLSRVGLRLIYSIGTADSERAAAAVLSKRIFVPPAGFMDNRPFGGKWLLPEIAFRWEGRSLGVSYRLRAETRTYNLSIPPEFPAELKVQSIQKELYYVTLDLDYYTTVSIPRDQFIVNEWIDSGLKILRREADRLLEGGGS